MTVTRPATIPTKPILVALLAASLTIGCAPDNPGGTVQPKAEADVKAAVEQRAATLTQLIGDQLPGGSVTPSPCTRKAGQSSDDVYTMIGIWSVPLPAERHLSTLTQIKNDLSAKAWTITEHRQINNTRGILTAIDPDNYELNLTSAVDSTAFRLMVSSPCFASKTAG